MSNPSEPATNKGTTTQAGDGVSDEQFAEEVSSETDPNLDAEDVFKRESEGASTDAPVASESADDVR
jgi:hypothetical protein